jgi:hypothetical protein
MTTKASSKPLSEAVKPTISGEKTPQIVPNEPQVAKNPVPATDKDTPVLIQYSEPDPANAPAPAAPVAPAAPDTSQAEALESVKEVVSAALDAVATATQPAPAGNTTTIKVLRSHPKLGAFAGETTAINTKLANELIEGGFAVQVSADGEAVASSAPTSAQLANAKSAYERFVAVADAGTDGAVQEISPAFADLPREMQCAFVAAVDSNYVHQVAK